MHAWMQANDSSLDKISTPEIIFPTALVLIVPFVQNRVTISKPCIPTNIPWRRPLFDFEKKLKKDISHGH
jgi:hypothetical protein